MRLKGLLALALLAAVVWLGRSWIADRYRGARDRIVGDRADHEGGQGDVTRPAQPGTDALTDLSGRAITISLLTMDPASHYLADVDAAGLAEERAALARVAPDVVLDPYLSRAAGELAAQAAALGAVVPDGALDFVLHAAGAPEPTVFHFLVRTNSDKPREIDDALRAALARRPDRRDMRVGVGEAAADGRALGRFIVVLVSTRPYQLDSVARQASPSSTWPLRLAAPGWSELSASILYPDGRVETAPARTLGTRFAIDVPTGELTGTVAVSIDGVGPEGPGKLLQVTVEVGQPPPRSIDVLVPPAEGDLADRASAERFAFELVNMDRKRHGLEPVERDPALDAVARAHSEDMRVADYFAHMSPTTGLPVDRLRRAGYQASASGENIALNDSLAEAQASLMASVGHRKNILSPRYTHVGLGLASRVADERTQWWVTQVFARRVERVDTAHARQQILGWLNQKRDAESVAALSQDAALDAIAQRGAARALSGAIDGLPAAVGAEARPHARGGATVSVQSFHHLTDFVMPKGVATRRMELAGIGVAQDEDTGRIGVVVIVARGG